MKFIQFRTEEPAPPSPPLTMPQCNVLRDLIQGRTMTEAARNATIHRSTIHRWMAQDNFRLTLENAQREYYLASFFELHTLVRPSIERLREAALSPKTSAATSLKITQWLFTQLAKGQPAIPTTGRENRAIMDNLLDAAIPEIDVCATKCDTQHAISQTSQAELNATECDTPAAISPTSQPEPDAIEIDLEGPTSPVAEASEMTRLETEPETEPTNVETVAQPVVTAETPDLIDANATKCDTETAMSQLTESVVAAPEPYRPAV